MELNQQHDIKEQERRTCIGNSDGVDELVEEASGTAPPLEHRDTLRARMEGEEFNQEG